MDIESLLKSDPDLICYYNSKNSDVQKITEVNSSDEILDYSVRRNKLLSVNNNDIVSLDNETPYDIGWFCASNSFFKDENNKLIGKIVDAVFSFPFGSLVVQNSQIDIFPPNSTTPPSFAPNKFITLKIISGQKDFINSTGYVIIATDNTEIRKVMVYFDKK